MYIFDSRGVFFYRADKISSNYTFLYTLYVVYIYIYIYMGSSLICCTRVGANDIYQYLTVLIRYNI